MLRSGCRSLLSSSIGNCPLIASACAWRSANVLSLYKNHDVSPYGSRVKGTRLKLSCISFAVNLSSILWLLGILPSIRVVLWYHRLISQHCQFSSLYQYLRCIPPLCEFPEKSTYLPFRAILHSKTPHIIC